MNLFADYRAHTGMHPEKFFKSTLFQSARLLLGLNCLGPGQSRPCMPTQIKTSSTSSLKEAAPSRSGAK